jgi:hypothetical protein
LAGASVDMTRGNKIRGRTSWEWDMQAILASEEAAECLKLGMVERAAEWSRLAVIAQDAANLKRATEKHSPAPPEKGDKNG